MEALTSAEIEAMRTEIESTLTTDCTINRSVTESNGKGGTKTTSQTTATCKCSIHPARDPGERQLGDRVVPGDLHVVTLPHNTDVLSSDTITIAGATYQIVGILTRTPALCIRALVSSSS